ncbi:MAG: hypothetical protein A3D13_08415 [Planctomycetes bacterium RIFCSPHIGHO2_02_FULL_40_12]|nr:MAG: hypothetical protein A3D13_08415 [Planctomycetes bacterium RIFCSPHIGHO2_02_FULL_40_12]
MSFPEKLTAVILAGGLGTRLRSVVGDCPKILALVNNRPFLSYLLDQLLCNDFSHVILCTGHGAGQVSAAFGNVYKGLTIEYSLEAKPLGTGGAIRNAILRIKTNNILVMNGDSYINVDLKTYIEWHFRNCIEVSLLLTQVSNTSYYGSVYVDKNGLVKQFVEKNEATTLGWINAGIYISKKRLISQIPAGESFSLEYDFFPNFVGKGLHGFKCNDSFIDIGTPESYDKADQFFKILETK